MQEIRMFIVIEVHAAACIGVWIRVPVNSVVMRMPLERHSMTGAAYGHQVHSERPEAVSGRMPGQARK
jgi:hypothetical protein